MNVYFDLQKTSILDVTEEDLKVFQNGDSYPCRLFTKALL